MHTCESCCGLLVVFAWCQCPCLRSLSCHSSCSKVPLLNVGVTGAAAAAAAAADRVTVLKAGVCEKKQPCLTLEGVQLNMMISLFV